MTDKTQQLEQIVSQLKVRAFDLQEQVTVGEQNIETLKQFIFKIAIALGIDKTPNLTVDTIIEQAVEVIEKSTTKAEPVEEVDE
ncbi:hypothetical protein [Erwinia phage FBB1]|nr:hypothetical protein [Erwinia phage FBB1]